NACRSQPTGRHTKPAGRLSFLPLFAWKTAVQTIPSASFFDPQCCRRPATSAQLQVGTKSPTHHTEKEPEPGIRVDGCGLLCMGHCTRCVPVSSSPPPLRLA